MQFVSAGQQPTQQFNKIYLNPFYRATISSGTNYNYNVTINPPDAISSVVNAMIEFNIQINGQSQTFTLLVNGQACNNPTYAVTTAFSTTGEIQAYFDCSNIITQSGNYNLTLSSAVNTGTITGWVDLTYMNKPKGAMQISGTEYSPNNPATIFVQLKDSQGLPISNGSCYIDVYAPLVNGTHQNIISDAPMIFEGGEDGLYYYDLIAPSTLGVYMLSAECSYAFNLIKIYPPEETVFFPIEQQQSGNWQGTSQVLNSRTDALYERCDGTVANPCTANYTFNISQYGTIENITNINVYFSGQDDVSGRILNISYWNGTAFIGLPNTLTFSGTGTTAPTPYDEFLTNSLPTSAILGGTVKLRLFTTGSARVFYNWLSLTLLSSEGTIQDVKGSGEMHITNIPNDTANAVWNYNNTINPNILSQFSSSVWTIFNSTYNFVNLIVEGVWTRTDRNLTYYPAPNNLTAQEIWEYSNRTLTYYDVTVINETSIALNVWNATTRELTHYVVNNISASDIWNYGTRELTFYPTVNLSISNLSANAVASAVWGYSGTVDNNILNQFSTKVQCVVNNLLAQLNGDNWGVDISVC